jgi:SNF2 family DNA or RNA helicase
VIVLHAAWVPRANGLALWGEDNGRSPAPFTRRGRRQTRPRPEPHPFALDTEGIRLALTELGGFAAQDAIAKALDLELTLELPVVGVRPSSSPWLEEDLVEPPSTKSSPPDESLVLWTAPGIILEPSEAADLLLALTTSNPTEALSEQTGIAPAFDLRFAARSAEMALELITRGRLLPSLERTDDGWRARWRPLIDAHDRGRIEALVWALPSSFMAAVTTGAGRDPKSVEVDGQTPDQILRSFMWTVTDSLARRFVADRASPVPSAKTKRQARFNATGAWLRALSSPEGTVDADEDGLQALSDSLATWSATVNTESEPVRICFRIVPPAEDVPEEIPVPSTVRRSTARQKIPDDWRIEFALQAVDDPSLLVSAETVWEDGPELAALERHAKHPDEHLLRGLGRAARLVPSIGSALTTAMPVAQSTDATGALEFLRISAPVLEQAGFGVLAPPWWRSSKRRVGLRLKARTPSPSPTSNTASIGLDALCAVEWEAVLGDDKIGLAELRQLARLKQPLVRVRGQWVELREGDIEAAIAAVDKKAHAADHMSAGELVRAALGVEPVSGDLPVSAVEADGWLGDLLAGAEDQRLQARTTPDGFVGELRPYQERGLGWLAFLGSLGFGACLADDMGLGKTAQLLALVLEERSRSKGPTLVLCPMSLVGNWQREAARFTPDLSVYVHHGQNRLEGKAFARNARKADLVLSTYGLAARDQQLLATVKWNRLVLDEAQQIKNSAARTTQSVRAIPADRRIAMTGTPVENRLSELWSIMQFLNPGLLGSEKGFRERFAIPIERDGDDEVAEKLRRITAPFVLRRLKTDRSIIADLPDKLEMKEFCTLTREQASLYQAVVDDMLARIDEADGIERRGLVLATMMKLKQVCNHPAHFLADGSSLPGRSGKLTRLTEVLEEAVSEGDRALVFTQFTEMGNLLERHLRRHLGCDVAWLHGGVTKKKRDEMVERFQAADGPGVFLLSLKAGGTGLNLTAATHVVHFDRWWNPAVEDQATDRAFRIGQKRNVQVRKFVCGGTLEERIDAMIESKRALAERIVGKGEGWITEMSTDQIREVIALSADAMGED